MGVDFDAIALGIPFNFWVFVGGSHFLDRDIHRYVLPYERNRTIVGYTAIRNNFEFRDGRMMNRGIDVDAIRRVTRRNVQPYRLADTDRPGAARVGGREVRFYRPSIRENQAERPKNYLDRDQARRELAPAKIYEPPRQAPAPRPESTVRKRQAEEQTLLRKSQAEERKNMERRRTEETRKMQGQAEKAKTQQEYGARMSEQQKRHQAEQQQMNERHRQDAERVRQSEQSKEQAPPPSAVAE
jgi:hypothetical protein